MIETNRHARMAGTAPWPGAHIFPWRAAGAGAPEAWPWGGFAAARTSDGGPWGASTWEAHVARERMYERFAAYVAEAGGASPQETCSDRVPACAGAVPTCSDPPSTCPPAPQAPVAATAVVATARPVETPVYFMTNALGFGTQSNLPAIIAGATAPTASRNAVSSPFTSLGSVEGLFRA